MKSRIHKIIETRNIKVVGVWVKKDAELYSYLLERYGDDYTVGEMVSMCLHDMDSAICKNGKKRKMIKMLDGFGYCGIGKKCQCLMEGVSERTKAGYAKRTDVEKSIANEKRKATTIERYGQANVSQVDSIKTKRGDTLEAHHGVRSMFSSLEAKERGMMKSHGVVNPSHSSEINAKRVATNLKEYGGHPAQQHFTPEIREILNDKDKLVEFMSTRSHKTIMSELGISQTGLLGYKLRHGIEVHSRSSYETEMKHEFDSWGIAVKSDDRMVLRPFADSPSKTKELDFYFKDHNLAIEFCGIHYHLETTLNSREEANNDITFGKKYHMWKHDRCEELGIKLITIFEDEYLNNKDVVLSRIRNALGLSEKGVYARKTTVVEIDKSVANKFLNRHHIQGTEKSSCVHYGAFYDNTLLGVMTFSKQRSVLGNSHKEGNFELLRFATDGDTHTGMASKLFRAFTRDYNPEEVISYADRRWSAGGVYNNMGFTHTHNSKPSYWYVKHSHLDRHHRSAFQKHKIVEKLGGDPNKSEWVNMQEIGYDRIWDCGTMVFVWKSQ